MSVRVFAPAKINLSLKVGGRRDDGRHTLQSVVMFADAGDWIEAASAQTLSLRVAGPFAAGLATDDNLVLRAARALGVDRGATLMLEKNLPVASGVGGGSSDAAATLKALNALWSLALDDSALTRLAFPLGADVPACLAARPLWMTGVGEKIAPLPIPPLHAVLVNSRQPLATAAVFATFDKLNPSATLDETPPPVWRTPGDVAVGARALGNDLEAAARVLAPSVGDILDTLRADARTRYAALSGSGATCFALVDDAVAARSLAKYLASTLQGHWVRDVSLLGA